MNHHSYSKIQDEMEPNNWFVVSYRRLGYPLFLLFCLSLLIASLSCCHRIDLRPVPPTLKIGLVAPFEGLHRPLGYEALFGVKLALQERNRQGVAGYHVELVALNDFNDPADAVMSAKALIADPDVVGLVGHLSAVATEAAAPIYSEAELAVVVPWPVGAETIRHHQSVVSITADTEQILASIEALSREQALEKVAALKALADLPTSADVDALHFMTDAVAAGEMILAARQAGFDAPLLGQTDVGSPQVVQVAESAANGLMFVSPGPAPADVVGGAAFIEAYQQLAGFPPGPRALLAYDATHVLLDGIALAVQEQGEPPTRSAVSAALVHVQRDSLSGTIRFDAEGQRLEMGGWMYQIVNQEYPGVLIAHP